MTTIPTRTALAVAATLALAAPPAAATGEGLSFHDRRSLAETVAEAEGRDGTREAVEAVAERARDGETAVASKRVGRSGIAGGFPFSGADLGM
jgi:hypothetical protein